MSFRKRNTVIRSPGSVPLTRQDKDLSPGTRPSPLDGRLTTSTGTASLDQLLAGHSGLPLGSSLLVEEGGTTDFGGILLRYYAAEGLVQGHHVHLLGAGEGWRRELPGLATGGNSRTMDKAGAAPPDKMKIAWRYEALGSSPAPLRDLPDDATAFCHAFDLTTRLEDSSIRGQFYSSRAAGDAMSRPAQPPFKSFIGHVVARLKASSPSAVHRILVPSLLSPTLYGSAACQPHEVLQFLHSLRSLLRQFPTQITALATLPVSLYSRDAGLTRWMELLFDSVIELTPLQRHSQVSCGPAEDGKAQGFLRIHSLPVFHEKGGGLEGACVREDLFFKLSVSRGIVIMPFSLPPVGAEDEAAERSKTRENAAQKQTLDF